MAKQRMVNTKFWSDSWIVELDPLERYLYLYLLTNEHTNIAGVYELPMRVMAFETGIDKEMLPKILKRFEGKIVYEKGWICIKNFQKHQSSSSEKVKRGIEIEMSKIPQEIRVKLKKGYGMDRVSKGIIYSNTNSNLNSNTNTNSKDVYGEFENVKLSKEEYTKLSDLIGEDNLKILIFELDTYIASKGKRYKSHYATIQTWARRKSQELQAKNKGKGIV